MGTRLLAFLLALLSLALVGRVAPAGEAMPSQAPDPGKSIEVELAWTEGRIGTAHVMTLPFRAEPPKGLVPPPGIEDARYTRIRWGSGPGLDVVLDGDAAAPRLWFDHDLDHDLSKETALAWFPPGQGGTKTTTVQVRYEDVPQPLSVELRLYRAPVWARDLVRIVPWVRRAGKAVLARRLRDVVLVDDNSDLRFDDPKRDLAYVDLDGDGRLRTGAKSPERMRPGAVFRIGEEAWTLTVPSPSGRLVRFVPVDPASVPAPAKPPWPRSATPAAGVKLPPPPETFEELSARVKRERREPAKKRTPALSLLGRLGSPEARKLLVGLAEHDPDPEARAAAVRALGNPAWRDEIVGKLEGWTHASVPNVAVAAIDALHRVDDPKRLAIYTG
ncbi:MAG: HEAT repeat domain-containing protein, partial [Planctomycetota bacterium]